jgi:hypothetical protein
MATALSPTLPLELRRDAERLFDLSMWCLGRDLKHPEGNLLLRFGLTRERPPEGHGGQSVYTATLAGGGSLKLWGFGALCEGGDTAVYIARAGFTPRLAEVACMEWPIFDAERLHAAHEPVTFQEQRACRAGVAVLAEWLARYEQWVADGVGVSWRSLCFSERRKASPSRPEQLAAAWWRIATQARACDFTMNDEIAAPSAGA